MDRSIGSRAKKAWNAFFNRDPTGFGYGPGTGFDYEIGAGYSNRPDRVRMNLGSERSIITGIYTRIAMDVASTSIQHVRLDDSGRFLDVIDSSINRRLNLEANIDQTSKAFIQDVVLSMFDEGSVAVVPVQTDVDPRTTDSYKIGSLRTGKIVQWYPRAVKVSVYNDRLGRKEEVTLPKTMVAIIENPLYAIMNEPNSILRRLIHKLNLLDAVDNQSSSGKLDLIIQLPYVIRSDARQKEAERRRTEIEAQLTRGKYGIAYTDGTETVTQLNRPVDNNLMKQIEYLTTMLFSQMGLTDSIFNGTADDRAMTNYFSRTVEPIVAAIVDELHRKFLSPTARTQNQAIRYFRDPFGFIPASQISEIADKFTRNEIMSPNEVRQIIGMRSSNDPKADELRNRNVSEAKTEDQPASEKGPFGVGEEDE